MNYFIPLTAAVLFAACGGGASTADDGTTAGDNEPAASAPAIDLAAHGLPLVMTPPDKQLTGGEEHTFVWKDETGTLEVRAGERFGLEIREEPGDIPRLKGTLERDLLRKHTVLRETPEMLTYRSEFPDDPGLVFIHFYQVVTAGDRTFTVQDIDGPAYNQQDIERMMAAISPRPPA